MATDAKRGITVKFHVVVILVVNMAEGLRQLHIGMTHLYGVTNVVEEESQDERNDNDGRESKWRPRRAEPTDAQPHVLRGYIGEQHICYPKHRRGQDAGQVMSEHDAPSQRQTRHTQFFGGSASFPWALIPGRHFGPLTLLLRQAVDPAISDHSTPQAGMCIQCWVDRLGVGRPSEPQRTRPASAQCLYPRADPLGLTSAVQSWCVAPPGNRSSCFGHRPPRKHRSRRARFGRDHRG